MARHVVVGKGPVGSATAQLLAERGHEVLVLSAAAAGAPTPCSTRRWTPRTSPR
jgi:glycine/D-amino acid oxidase-like deaminating enzyme